MRKRKVLGRAASVLLSAGIVATNVSIPYSVLNTYAVESSTDAYGVTVYEITSKQDLADAIAEIRANTEDNKEYILNLNADIEYSNITLNVHKATITIIGNGHTISNVGIINVNNGCTLNLGSDTDSSTLTLVGIKNNDLPGMVHVTSGSTLNMYDGVTLKDSTGNNYFGGAITSDRGTINMYGGTIENCGIKGGSICFGGAVALARGSIFNMYDGVIKDCFVDTSLPSSNAGLIPWGAGGAVFVGGGSTFNLEGGEITNCTASETGGGVFVVASVASYSSHSSFGYLDSAFNMSGGSINNCSSTYYGGGIAASGYYVNASAIATATPGNGLCDNPGIRLTGGEVVDNSASAGAGLFGIMLNDSSGLSIDGCAVVNNLADTGGSDIYVQEVSGTIFDISSVDYIYNGLPADLTGKAIGGWFEDYDDARFVDQAEDARVLVEEFTLPATDSIELVAAPTFTVEYLESFEIGKEYLDGRDTTKTDTVTPGDNTLKEDVKVTIEPYTSFNREYVSISDQTARTDMPDFESSDKSNNVYTITADDGDDTVEIELPDFSSYGVGDYWYKVTEVEGSTAGVKYTDAEYFIHIVVTRESKTTLGVTQVTLHKTAPESDGTYKNETDDKVENVTNEYFSGELSIKKEVKGNMGDSNKLFKVTVEFAAPTGKTVTGDIQYTGAFNADGEVITDGIINGNWDSTVSVDVYVKNGSTVKFTNIPQYVTYKVVEDDYSADGYKMPTYTFDATETDDVANTSADTWSENYATGLLDDESDILTLTNEKDSSIDVGIIVDYIPYMIVGAIAVVGGTMLVIKKRREDSEEA